MVIKLIFSLVLVMQSIFIFSQNRIHLRVNYETHLSRTFFDKDLVEYYSNNGVSTTREFNKTSPNRPIVTNSLSFEIGRQINSKLTLGLVGTKLKVGQKSKLSLDGSNLFTYYFFTQTSELGILLTRYFNFRNNSRFEYSISNEILINMHHYLSDQIITIDPNTSTFKHSNSQHYIFDTRSSITNPFISRIKNRFFRLGFSTGLDIYKPILKSNLFIVASTNLTVYTRLIRDENTSSIVKSSPDGLIFNSSIKVGIKYLL